MPLLISNVRLNIFFGTSYKIKFKKKNLPYLFYAQNTYINCRRYWVTFLVLSMYEVRIKYIFFTLTLLNKIFTVTFHFILPYFRQFYNYILSRTFLFVFLNTELFVGDLCCLPRNWNFNLWEFCIVIRRCIIC